MGVRPNPVKKTPSDRMSHTSDDVSEYSASGENHALVIRSLSECSNSDVSEEIGSEITSEYPDDINHLIDCLVSVQGEALADVMAGIRDALEKLNKILYNKL